jgi:flotillin
MSKPIAPDTSRTAADAFAHRTSGGTGAREGEGWRRGRPVEDPEKTKRWGKVCAKPSEFLVHVRGGQVRTRSSGQGASCFKWPGDSVAIIPTSLQQLRFRADQVTLERVGVEVVGFAVYRIVDPLVAFRVLNFSYPERAQEKLEQTLTAMFVGAARRLIANLNLEDCLQKRKAALADELVAEVTPVVAGRGFPGDTAQGWGIVIDTIEIQEVRVLSEAVFSQLQAPYRTALERRAREATAEANQHIAAKEAACARAVEEVRIQQAMVVAEQQRQQQEQAARLAQEEREAQLLRDAELRAREGQLALADAEQQTAQMLALLKLQQDEAQAKLAAHAVAIQTAQAEAELGAVLAAHKRAEEELRLHLLRLAGETEAQVAREKASAEEVALSARARLEMARQLPALAQAVGSRIGEVKIVSYGDSTQNPFGQVTQAVDAVLDLVRQTP